MANITVISYPDNEINYTVTEPTGVDSAEMVQNIWVDLSETTTDEYVEIVFNGETITLLIQDECRYTPLDIAFQNKEGCLQFLTFFKAKAESMSITSEEYESDNGQPNVGNHQYKTYNINAKSKFKMSSGFVDEALNETFKQLMLSLKVWSYASGTFTPIKLGSKSIEYKTRQKDRLINYEIEFEYAFNEINNV
jgi:hypothetical protein